LTKKVICIVFCYEKRDLRKRSGKEARMFEVSQKADEMIQEFFKGKEDARNIRIFLSQGG